MDLKNEIHGPQKSESSERFCYRIIGRSLRENKDELRRRKLDIIAGPYLELLRPYLELLKNRVGDQLIGPVCLSIRNFSASHVLASKDTHLCCVKGERRGPTRWLDE